MSDDTILDAILGAKAKSIPDRDLHALRLLHLAARPETGPYRCWLNALATELEMPESGFPANGDHVIVAIEKKQNTAPVFDAERHAIRLWALAARSEFAEIQGWLQELAEQLSDN